MLGSTAICSAVFSVGPASGLLADLSPFPLDSGVPALLAAEDLRGMTAQKRSIARLPQAQAGYSIRLRDLRSIHSEIRLDVGQAGVRPVSQVSLAKRQTSQRGDFLNEQHPLL